MESKSRKGTCILDPEEEGFEDEEAPQSPCLGHRRCQREFVLTPVQNSFLFNDKFFEAVLAGHKNQT